MEEIFLNFLNNKAQEILEETGKLSASLFTIEKDKNALFLLNHNSQAFLKLFEFLKSEDKVFILKGYSGSGKSEITDLIVKNFLSENVLTFKFLWQTGTNLDDILLSIYKDFTVFASKRKIILPKTDTIIFSEKINSYIKHCDREMLFVFDYLELSFISQKKQDEFCDFINYLLKFPNIKILIISRALNPKDIKINQSVSSYALRPLGEEEVQKLLYINDIAFDEESLSRLVADSGGHYIFLSMFILLSEILDIKPQELFEEYKNKGMSFSDFLLQKNLALLSDKFLTLFYLLSVIRLGVSERFIISRKIASKDDLEYLLRRRIITYEFGLYYLKDFFKSKYLQTIPVEIKKKIYSELIDFYESLLPKKPFERDLLISRITMRKEIEACNDAIELLKIEKKKFKRPSTGKNFNYLSYSTMSNSEWNTQTPNYSPTNIPKISKKPSSTFGKAHLSKEDVNLLNLISPKDMLESELTSIVNRSEMLTNQAQETKNKEKDEEKNKQIEDFEELIFKAKTKESEFKYREAIIFYEKALEQSDNPLYEAKCPALIFRTAFCYRHIQETDKAVHLFQKAAELYSKMNSEKSITALLCVAQSYSEVYRFEEAKEAYLKVLGFGKVLPDNIFIRANLDMAEIEDNNLNTESAAGYANNALQTAEKVDNKKLLTESYFKYALYNDDLGNFSIALKYYLKCVQASDNIDDNRFLSPAYSNLALLCYEKSDIQSAILYHQKAIEIDEKLHNNEGLYFSYIKLSEIYKKSDYSKTYEYLIKALKVVRKSEDKTHLITVYIELGDCYFKTGKIRKAIKSYTLANKLIEEYSKFEELYTLEGKLSVLKNSIGHAKYSQYLKEISRK